MSVVLIDTSIWIAILREKSDEKLAERFQRLLREGRAAWCDMIQLEIWAGVRGAEERKNLRHIQGVVYDLEVSKTVWKMAFHTADKARSKGITVPASDILIHACAHEHNAEIWHSDKHFDALAKL